MKPLVGLISGVLLVVIQIAGGVSSVQEYPDDLAYAVVGFIGACAGVVIAWLLARTRNTMLTGWRAAWGAGIGALLLIISIALLAGGEGPAWEFSVARATGRGIVTGLVYAAALGLTVYGINGLRAAKKRSLP